MLDKQRAVDPKRASSRRHVDQDGLRSVSDQAAKETWLLKFVSSVRERDQLADESSARATAEMFWPSSHMLEPADVVKRYHSARERLQPSLAPALLGRERWIAEFKLLIGNVAVPLRRTSDFRRAEELWREMGDRSPVDVVQGILLRRQLFDKRGLPP